MYRKEGFLVQFCNRLCQRGRHVDKRSASIHTQSPQTLEREPRHLEEWWTMFQVSDRHARWTLGTAVMLVAAGLTLSQQTAQGQSQGRRVDEAVLRNAGTSGEDWLTLRPGSGREALQPAQADRRDERHAARAARGRSTSPAATTARRVAAIRKTRCSRPTACSTASRRGAWSMRSMRGPTSSSGSGIPK